MIKKVDVQGQNANKNGKWLETQVEQTLAKYGIKSIMYNDLDTEEGHNFVTNAKRGFLAKNVPYTNIFGSKAYGEFVLYLFGFGARRIECRSQHVSGSVQDKLPKLLEDCKCMQEQQVIIVLEGAGFSHNARAWLKNAASAIQYKDIQVQTLEEFKVWAKQTLVKSFKVPATHPLNSMIRNIMETKITKKCSNIFSKKS